MNLEAIILAGGIGSRLSAVVPDLPKPMAPVQGAPFLAWLLRYLERQGVQRAVISTGYLSHKIKAHFGARFGSVAIDYSEESESLGTGGAIRLALQNFTAPRGFVLNGDSFFDVNLEEMQKLHLQRNADLTMAVKPMAPADRYGTVVLKEDRVVGFREKVKRCHGMINGGLYLMESGIFNELHLPEKFSFENDFLTACCTQMKFCALISAGFFIDIGVPEDYARAQREFCFQQVAG